MARFGNIAEQFFDDNGDPLSSGKLYFYESGTTTPKDTYSDASLSTANANPVVLDAAGRPGDIFFSGQAKCVVKNASDVTIDTYDYLGTSTADSPFGDWDGNTTYSQGDIRTGTDGLTYISLQDSNLGNNPTSSATYWSRLLLARYWNTNETYSANQYVVDTDGFLYRSVQGSNQGNDPSADDGTWWNQTISNKTLNTVTLQSHSVEDAPTETVYTATGTGEALTASKGPIWDYTMSANATFTDSLSNGQSLALILRGGDSYTFTPPTSIWVNTDTPTLTADDLIIVMKVAGVLILQYVGEVTN